MSGGSPPDPAGDGELSYDRDGRVGRRHGTPCHGISAAVGVDGLSRTALWVCASVTTPISMPPSHGTTRPLSQTKTSLAKVTDSPPGGTTLTAARPVEEPVSFGSPRSRNDLCARKPHALLIELKQSRVCTLLGRIVRAALALARGEQSTAGISGFSPSTASTASPPHLQRAQRNEPISRSQFPLGLHMFSTGVRLREKSSTPAQCRESSSSARYVRRGACGSTAGSFAPQLHMDRGRRGRILRLA